MLDAPTDLIEYRTPCLLSDQLRVQFWCTLLQFKYLWIIFVVLFAIIVFTGDSSITGFLNNPWSSIFPLLFGLIGAFLFGPVIVVSRWLTGKRVKEIKVDITNQGMKIIGQELNFETTWPSLKWVREGRSVYLLKFKQLLVRLPKRGFSPETEARFRQMLVAKAPAASGRLRS